MTTMPSPYTAIGLEYENRILLAAAVDNNFQFYKIHDRIWVAVAPLGSEIWIDPIERIQYFRQQLCQHNYGGQMRVESAAKIVSQYFLNERHSNPFQVLLAGVDTTGRQIYRISSHGARERMPYAAIGAGQHLAMGFLDLRWKKDMCEIDAQKLANTTISDIINHSDYNLCTDFDLISI